MASRIQFRVTDDEYTIIAQNTQKAGYTSISQYAKDLAMGALNTQQTITTANVSFNTIYKNVEKAVNDKIATVKNAVKDNVEMEVIERKFVLRSITPGWGNIPQHTNTPTGTIPKPLRASIGKHFFEEVKAGKFKDIRCTGKTDGCGTMIYEVII